MKIFLIVIKYIAFFHFEEIGNTFLCHYLIINLKSIY